MATVLIFLALVMISYLFIFMNLGVYLYIVFGSLVIALLIRIVYLLHGIHEKYVYDNQSLSDRIIEKRKAE